MFIRTIHTSPSHPGPYYQDRRCFNPLLTEVTDITIDLNCNNGQQLISELNTQFSQRSFDFQNDKQQLELLRLEAIRRNILCTMDLPFGHHEKNPTRRSSRHFNKSLTPVGEPGPSVPTTLRNRVDVLSESEISLLDIGPSFHSSHDSIIASGCASGNKRNKLDPIRTTSPSFIARPASDGSNHASPSHSGLRAADLDSVAITSATASISNEFPLRVRQRRQDRPDLTLPGPGELRPSRDRRSYSGGHYDVFEYGYGYGFSGFSPTQTQIYFADERDRRIVSQSVPHSPTSPPGPRRPAFPRSQTSFEGMEPEFAAMHNAEQLKKARAARMAQHEHAVDDDEGEL